MKVSNIPPISAEVLAEKLENIANFEAPELLEEITTQPRLVELLWFLQFVSQPNNYAGGLCKFCDDFINEAAEEIGTSEMLLADHARTYTLAQLTGIYHELSATAQTALKGSTAEGRTLSRLLKEDEQQEDCSYGLVDLLTDDERAESAVRFGRAMLRAENDQAVRRAAQPVTKREQAAMLAEFTPAKLRAICVDVAREKLAYYFKRLCEEPSVTFRRRGSRSWTDKETRTPWYFPNVADALLAFIDHRKEQLAARIAETEVTKLVFEWMSVAQGTGRGVLIEGNSRFGKTEAIRVWCDMNPGVARLVNTPATNAVGDLLREVARALGVDSAPDRRGYDLRARIDYVLRFAKLLICFDESSFLLPGSYSKNTAPARLNWVRRSLMDRDIPVVFVHTPQSNLPPKKRFVKATGYTMEQFDERILMTVNLPATLCEDDLLAVARIHFPDLQEVHLKHVVSKVSATERNYVSDIEKIATLANYKAKTAGRSLPVLADINAAIANVLPAARLPVPVAGALVAQDKPQRQKRGAAAVAIATTIALPADRRVPAEHGDPPFVSRGVTPVAAKAVAP